MSIKILLVDDHAIVRQGLHSLLEKEPDIKVVGGAEDGRKALELTRELLPDVVVMDITMPNLNGVEAARLITQEFPKVKVIALSMHSDKTFVVSMLKAGASGYVLKECLSDELVEAIRAVAGDGWYISRRITGVVMGDYVNRLLETTKSPLETLTDRELQVLQPVVEGKSTKQIALELHVSTKAIEAARRKIMEKLDVHSVPELVVKSIQWGLISLQR
ncbi:MAG: response regulator transcription factor [Phycisphaerae bacterium]|nr:response regulator transcription factor [Phycisphaerae bacterium]MDD5381304.1 response regulator transcription factor [Phycisphaerae bacterium]